MWRVWRVARVWRGTREARGDERENGFGSQGRAGLFGRAGHFGHSGVAAGGLRLRGRRLHGGHRTGGEVAPARKKAEAMGVREIFVEDLREEFVRDFVFPMLRANAVYEGEYLLGTSIARPLIAKRLAEIARATGADAVAHGATGKGNDQIRFELGLGGAGAGVAGDCAVARVGFELAGEVDGVCGVAGDSG